MSAILPHVVRAYGFLLRRAVAREAADPTAPQRSLLLGLIRRNRGTDYGRRHSFASIRTERDFRRHVPMVQYEDIRPYIERIERGEVGVLTEDPVLMMSMTSGTTSRPKSIPVTARGQRRTRRLMMRWLSHALSSHRTLLDHGILAVTGAAAEGRCPCGIPFGSASGMMLKSLPSSLRRLFAAPAVISEVADYEQRCLLLARFAYCNRISFIATPNPLTLIRLAEIAGQHAEGLIRSIHNGWLMESCRDERSCAAAGIPRELLAAAAPDPTRARILDSILRRTGRLSPADCWPDLTLIGCWLGGSIGSRAEALSDAYGGPALRDLGYMASEGCVTLPMEDYTAAGMLALENHYYEFIPESEMDSAIPEVLTAGELSVGGCYKILLTNENGLYRYDIGDIVRVERFHGNTPVISFLRKSGDVLNICGEKLHLNHCLAAIAGLQSRFSLVIGQFRVVPNEQRLRHEFFLDIRSDVTETFIRLELLPALDVGLCVSNIEYAAKRRSKRINPPCIHVMDDSWGEDAQRGHAAFGKRDAQFKWAQLAKGPLDTDLRHIRYSVD